MIEIGKLKRMPVMRGFGKTATAVRDTYGEPVTKMVPSEVWRITRGALDGHFCRDKNRRLIVGLLNGDVLSLRPEGRLRRTAEVTVTLADIYSFCLRTQAMNKQLEKARTRKAKFIILRERRRVAAADRRLSQAAKNESV